jgi:RNA polymerase sigma factor (sigma-70 family)
MKKTINGTADLLKEVYGVKKFDKNVTGRLDEVLSELSPKEERIIRLRFGVDDNILRTYKEIGKEFGVSASCICQSAHRAIKKLKHPVRKSKIIKQ